MKYIFLTGQSVINFLMAPRTKIQNEEIRENRRQIILLSALELFSREGYHRTSIESIAKKAGISKGLVYNYFQSKEELLKDLILHGLKDMEQYLQIPQDTKFIKEGMQNLIDNVFEMFLTNQEFWKLYSSIIVQPDVLEVVSGEIKVMVLSQLNTLEEFIRKTGSKTPREDAYLLGAIFDGISLNYLFNPDGYPIESIKKRIKDIFLNK